MSSSDDPETSDPVIHVIDCQEKDIGALLRMSLSKDKKDNAEEGTEERVFHHKKGLVLGKGIVKQQLQQQQQSILVLHQIHLIIL